MPDFGATNRVVVEVRGNYIHVRESGNSSFDAKLKHWKQIVELCESKECYNVLGEFHSNSENVAHSIHYIEVFKLAGVTRKFRIAWVQSHPDCRDLRFTVTLLKNRSLLTGGLFESVDQAEVWLLQNEKAR